MPPAPARDGRRRASPRRPEDRDHPPLGPHDRRDAPDVELQRGQRDLGRGPGSGRHGRDRVRHPALHGPDGARERPRRRGHIDDRPTDRGLRAGGSEQRGGARAPAGPRDSGRYHGPVRAAGRADRDPLRRGRDRRPRGRVRTDHLRRHRALPLRERRLRRAPGRGGLEADHVRDGRLGAPEHRPRPGPDLLGRARDRRARPGARSSRSGWSRGSCSTGSSSSATPTSRFGGPTSFPTAG